MFRAPDVVKGLIASQGKEEDELRDEHLHVRMITAYVLAATGVTRVQHPGGWVREEECPCASHDLMPWTPNNNKHESIYMTSTSMSQC